MKLHPVLSVFAALLFAAINAPIAAAEDTPRDFAHTPWSQLTGGVIHNADPETRCGTLNRAEREALFGPLEGGLPTDCSASQTNPHPDYDSTVLYEIPVVFHLIQDSACSNGFVPDENVDQQVQVLNEDFLAIFGTNGENGSDVQVRFALATEDPGGNPTSGITRSCNTTWFNDNGSYWNTLAWDPNRYLNIYSNQASGALGYVPFLPADGGGSQVGAAHDRVVVLWSTVGNDAPIGPPFHLGRTATHEVGHYLGLEHTFTGGCSSGTPPGCYTSGDLICDTNPEASPTSGCPAGRMTCGVLAPIDNYMDYSSDMCMEMFTGEQSNRMRCTLAHYRTEVYSELNDIFSDGFESGDTLSWSSQEP